MAQKENQRIALTKQLLQNGLLRLLKQKNIQKINITELCKEAGINRSTFYKYYNTPYDVLTDMGNTIIRKFIDETNIENLTSLPDHRKFYEQLCRYLYENADTMKILIGYNLDSEISDVLKCSPKTHDVLVKLLERKFETEEIEMALTFIYSGAYNLIRKWIMEDIPKTPEEIADLILRMAISGWSEL